MLRDDAFVLVLKTSVAERQAEIQTVAHDCEFAGSDVAGKRSSTRVTKSQRALQGPGEKMQCRVTYESNVETREEAIRFEGIILSTLRGRVPSFPAALQPMAEGFRSANVASPRCSLWLTLAGERAIGQRLPTLTVG